MPAFQYKDLMITAGPFPRQCLCYGWSFHISHRPVPYAFDTLNALNTPAGVENPVAGLFVASGIHCLLHTQTQYLSPLHCNPTYAIPQSVVPNHENLAALKAQLHQAIENIERQEVASAESMQPQTEAEVDELHKKLREAMTELEKRREEIRRKAGK